MLRKNDSFQNLDFIFYLGDDKSLKANQDRLELDVYSIIVKSSRRIIDLEDILICKQSRHRFTALRKGKIRKMRILAAEP